ncbi:response regulator [Chamaesiphon sp. VAR_69_metabat_338]|uniref:response regulator n=1 Tax=Chamaesiphon sp. VAR_69_metabat_338 TaxID=2964704 RepID=UPI00286E12FD|nr:response regulator [Chamaesiphon sp. VAR_69_metabat_338]
MITTSPNNVKFKDLITQFNQIRTEAFSGNLIVRVEHVPNWMLCFTAGRLAGMSGGIDAIERWRRNLALAAQIQPKNVADDRQEALLNANQLAQSCAAKEVLFDIIQFSQNQGDRLFYQLIPVDNNNNNYVKSVLPLLEIQAILTETIQDWQEWKKAGLASYAPSLVPVIDKSVQISMAVNGTPDLQALISAIDDRKTLRSLAIDRHQKLIDVGKYLLPLLTARLIALSPIGSSAIDGNLPDSGLNADPKILDRHDLSSWASDTAEIAANKASVPKKVGSLIACVDDSLTVYKNLEQIITAHGHRAFGVQDPLKIIPSLIRNKPDLIFLDLVMPVTNGYEVCEQIRKTPSLANVPVIILTGSDGLIDRVRTKFIGANGFLSKPIQAEAIVKTIDKYLKKKPAIVPVSARVKSKQALVHSAARQRSLPLPDRVAKRVLIIDDDRNIREIVSMCLHKLKGWDILTAASGREGLIEIATNTPDAIVLDMMMPEMDGLAFLRQLRAQDPTKIIPVILLTASRHIPSQQRLQELGVVNIVAKPFLPIDLVRQIDRVLG